MDVIIPWLLNFSFTELLFCKVFYGYCALFLLLKLFFFIFQCCNTTVTLNYPVVCLVEEMEVRDVLIWDSLEEIWFRFLL